MKTLFLFRFLLFLPITKHKSARSSEAFSALYTHSPMRSYLAPGLDTFSVLMTPDFISSLTPSPNSSVMHPVTFLTSYVQLTSPT